MENEERKELTLFVTSSIFKINKHRGRTIPRAGFEKELPFRRHMVGVGDWFSPFRDNPAAGWVSNRWVSVGEWRGVQNMYDGQSTLTLPSEPSATGRFPQCICLLNSLRAIAGRRRWRARWVYSAHVLLNLKHFRGEGSPGGNCLLLLLCPTRALIPLDGCSGCLTRKFDEVGEHSRRRRRRRRRGYKQRRLSTLSLACKCHLTGVWWKLDKTERDGDGLDRVWLQQSVTDDNTECLRFLEWYW